MNKKDESTAAAPGYNLTHSLSRLHLTQSTRFKLNTLKICYNFPTMPIVFELHSLSCPVLFHCNPMLRSDDFHVGLRRNKTNRQPSLTVGDVKCGTVDQCESASRGLICRRPDKDDRKQVVLATQTDRWAREQPFSLGGESLLFTCQRNTKWWKRSAEQVCRTELQIYALPSKGHSDNREPRWMCLRARKASNQQKQKENT